MVIAFMIQTLNPKGCDILYYRAFTCYNSGGAEGFKMKNTYKREDNVYSFGSNTEGKASDQCSTQSYFRPPRLFETSAEKKELFQHIACKVQMEYSMKVKHSLVPMLAPKQSLLKGIFMERKENSVEMPIIWQGVPGLGFVLVCNKSENYLQAHNVLNVIIQQLEKHLQILTNPALALTIIETVALIVNQFLPGGQLLFMNSRFVRQFEKQLESHLFSK
jgi:hypothetical protein